MSNRAVFFDRDGTLVRDPGYLSHPDQVELLDGAAEAIKELQLLGYKTVVVSNQSGIARGILTEEMLEQIHARLRELLSRKGAALDGIYYCPYHPDGAVPKYRKESDWRKPKPGMLLAAAGELDIDLMRSWMIGDNYRDTEAGRSAGCKTILISSAHTSAGETDANKPDHVAVNLKEAINIVKKYHRSEASGQVTPATPAAEAETAPVTSEPQGPPTQEQQDVTVLEPPMQTPAPESATASEPSTTNVTIERLGREIIEQLRRMQKAETFDEFSLVRVLAGIVQVFVPFCLLIALWLLMSSDQQTANIMIALGFATVLQIMALTFYIMRGRR
jgi:D-glycero-D-manno-heptose 1,7-bisphosphate phosphatase